MEIPRGLADVCRPDRMALVVYDMQVAIARQLPAIAPAVTAACAEILAAARAGAFPVVFMRHTTLPRRLMGAFQLRQAMAWQKQDDPAAVVPWFPPEGAGTAIVPELAPHEDEAVLDKISFSAFEGTPLATVLRDLGLDSFAICGIALEIGIDPTVRHACDLGLMPVVVADACGSGHEEAGARALANLRFVGDAIVTDRAALIARMDRTA